LQVARQMLRKVFQFGQHFVDLRCVQVKIHEPPSVRQITGGQS
jgi:hypothetical protein